MANIRLKVGFVLLYKVHVFLKYLRQMQGLIKYSFDLSKIC
jgi:hypothetical protein